MYDHLTDARAIEQRLLELAHTTDAKLTPAALAYFAPCGLDDAAAVLEQLAARDRLTMNVQDDGSIVYELPGRQRLAMPAEPRLAPALVRTRRGRHHASPVVAAALTTFIPGAGHLYAGKVLAAFMWFLVVGAGYALILPGLILHMFAVVSSAAAAYRVSAPSPRLLVGRGVGGPAFGQ